MFRKALTTALVASALIAAAGPAPAQQAAQLSCMSQDAARSVLAQNPALLSLSTAAQRGGVGQIVSADFCMFNGQYVYVINALGAGGAVRRVIISAANGSIVG
ncbi:MAG: hypothetical protein IT534_00280 [Bauldia sp.]|nr:hypothetical protein [Bauldia sp.]